jgi:hypothetical protein
LDLLVAGAVEELPLAAPPISPMLGASYTVAQGAADAWAGKSQCVAGWTSGGWRFVAPVEGMSLFVRATATWAMFRGGAWEIGLLSGDAVVIGGEQVIGSRAAAIADPAGGATVDNEARTAIGAILGALREHGLIEI